MFLFIVYSVCDEPTCSMTTRVLVNLPPGIVSPAASQLQPLSVKASELQVLLNLTHKRATSTAVLCSPTLSLFPPSRIPFLLFQCYIASAKPAVSHSQEAALGTLTFAWECSQKCRTGFMDGESIAAEDEQVRPNCRFFLQRSTTH